MLSKDEIKKRVDTIFVELTGKPEEELHSNADLREDLAMNDESIAEFLNSLNLSLNIHIFIKNIKMITTMRHLYAAVDHELNDLS